MANGLMSRNATANPQYNLKFITMFTVSYAEFTAIYSIKGALEGGSHRVL